jgi:hypothetical protein
MFINSFGCAYGNSGSRVGSSGGALRRQARTACFCLGYCSRCFTLDYSESECSQQLSFGMCRCMPCCCPAVIQCVYLPVKIMLALALLGHSIHWIATKWCLKPWQPNDTTF